MVTDLSVQGCIRNSTCLWQHSRTETKTGSSAHVQKSILHNHYTTDIHHSLGIAEYGLWRPGLEHCLRGHLSLVRTAFGYYFAHRLWNSLLADDEEAPAQVQVVSQGRAFLFLSDSD